MIKGKSKQVFSLLMLGMLISMLMIAVAPVQAMITTTYSETFTTDTVNANPSSSTAEGAWYTYGEYGWVYANVNASHHFLINDSKSTAAACYSNFTFASLPSAHSAMDVSHWTSFYFEFRYNNSMKASAKSNMSGVEFKMKGSTYTICTVHVYGLNETVAANKNRIVITNYSGAVKANHTTKYGFTYSLSYDPDYSANTITVILANESNGGTVMNTTTMTMMGESNMHELQIQNYPASRTVYIWIDNMYITKAIPDYTQYSNIVQEILIVAIPAIIFVYIMFLAISGNITTPEALVSLLVIFFLAMIAVSFLFS